MLSKFVPNALRLLVTKTPQKHSVRKNLGLIPPSQYDIPYPKKLRFGYVIREYWETIPLFVTTFISFSVLASAILWAFRNKVDTVFSTHSRNNISRTMDLRNPTVHKIVIINQRYEPWPEMQDVLDKMAAAEKRALVVGRTVYGRVLELVSLITMLIRISISKLKGMSTIKMLCWTL